MGASGSRTGRSGRGRGRGRSGGGDRSWTVEDVLGAPSLSGARILAGAAGLTRVVERLNVMEVPDVVPWTAPNELLLTTGYPLRDDPDQLVPLIAELDRVGLAGLGVKVGRFLAEVPAAAVARAETLGFPLIELPTELRIDDVLHDVLGRMLDRARSDQRSGEQLHRSFLDVVLAGGGLPDIAGALAAHLGTPVAVVDLVGTVLAGIDLQSLGLDPAERLPVPPGGHGVLVGGLHLSAASVVAGRRWHGWVVAIGRAPIAEEDGAALEHAATMVALTLTQAEELRAVEDRYRTGLMHDLLAGGDDPSELRRRATDFGWDVDRELIVLVARREAEGSPDGTEEVRDLDVGARRLFTERDPGAAVVAFGREVVALTAPFRGPTGRADAVAFAGRVSAALARAVGGPVSIGLARPVPDASRLTEAYEQARRAVAIGRRVHGPMAVAHFDELGVHRVLASVPEPELRSFAQEVLGPLAAPDAGMLDLRRTLRELLRTGGNVAEAARRLHFHYNTLRYRIEKLRALLGPFTEDARLRLDVEVALLILEHDDATAEQRG